jgi:hypothetical protein
MTSYRRRTAPAAPRPLVPLTRLWILRMMVPLAGHRELVGARSFMDDALALALGLEEWIDPEDRDFDPAAVRTRLRELHRQAERAKNHGLPAILETNIARLAELVGLDAAERAILSFATCFTTSPPSTAPPTSSAGCPRWPWSTCWPCCSAFPPTRYAPRWPPRASWRARAC